MIQYTTIPGLKYRAIKTAKVTGVEDIINAVCCYYDIPPIKLKVRSRQRELVQARYICMRLMFEMLGMTKKSIGKIFNQDHSTVIHGLHVCEDLIQTEPIFRNDLLLIQNKL